MNQYLDEQRNEVAVLTVDEGYTGVQSKLDVGNLSRTLDHPRKIAGDIRNYGYTNQFIEQDV
ncbi:MAG: hypothetical protein NHB32_09215 [Fischerella sp. CENA71]|nr:hypothetical protein [Fischerella sp. CENA71]